MTQRKILRRAASRSVPAAFCVILLVAFLSPSEGVGKVDDNAVVMPLGADVGAAYDIRRTGNTEQDVVAVHPRQDLRFEFRGASVALSPRMGDRWQVELAYAGHGRADRAFAYAEPRAQHADGHRVELDRGPGLTEWYLHLPEGLEQGFTLRERPEGPSEVELVVAIDVVGELTPELGRGGAMVVLRDFSGRARLRYAGLVAFDSSGRELPARMEVHARRILLRVDDRGARYPVIIDPLLFENKVVGSDTTAGDSFGHAVAVDGSYAVVGAPGHDPGAGSFEGVVYFYKRSGESWVNRGSGSCQLSDAGCDAFGSAVDLEGEWGVVGAPGLGGTTTSGRVVLYRLSGGLFIRHSVLTLPAAAVNELFGASVSIAFPYLVVGAPGDDEEGTNAGAVYLYWFLNDAWVQFAKLTASDGGPFDGFGRAVAIDEDTFVVGAPGHDGVGTDTGAVYTFTRGAVLWFEDDDVLLPAPDMNNGAAFGRALAILDNRLLVGVWQDSRAFAIKSLAAFARWRTMPLN